MSALLSDQFLGRPLLDYTLEWLLHNGLSEVILYLSSNPAKIKSWLSSSRWRQDSDSKPLKITTIVNEESASLGDACRDLDEKGVSMCGESLGATL